MRLEEDTNALPILSARRCGTSGGAERFGWVEMEADLVASKDREIVSLAKVRRLKYALLFGQWTNP